MYGLAAIKTTSSQQRQKNPNVLLLKCSFVYLQQRSQDQVADKLQLAKLKLMTRHNCIAALANLFKNNAVGNNIIDYDGQVCAVHPKSNTCRGDSGGPLMLPTSGDPSTRKVYQLGIVSRGVWSCQKGAPTIYTRVLPYIDWIKGTLKP